MTALRWRALAYDVPLATPLLTARGLVARRAGFFVACAGGGVTGLGEVAPWPDWGTESVAAVAAVVAGWPVDGPMPADVAGISELLLGGPALRAGMELALLDWLARGMGVGLWALLRAVDAAPPSGLTATAPPGPAVVPGGLPSRCARPVPPTGGKGVETMGGSLCALSLGGERVPVRGGEGAKAQTHKYIPIAALLGVHPVANALAAVAAGHTTLKLKVGDPGGPARALAVREAIGPAISLRLDANGAWPDVPTALAALHALAPAAPAFVEQPVPAEAIDDLLHLAQTSPVPVAADEALGQPGALDRLLVGGVRHLVIKPLLHGGFLAARDAIARARLVGASVVLSSALDRGVGTFGVLHLAAAHPHLPAPGLDTARCYADGGVLAGLVPAHGNLAVPDVRAITDPALAAWLADVS